MTGASTNNPLDDDSPEQNVQLFTTLLDADPARIFEVVQQLIEKPWNPENEEFVEGSVGGIPVLSADALGIHSIAVAESRDFFDDEDGTAINDVLERVEPVEAALLDLAREAWGEPSYAYLADDPTACSALDLILTDLNHDEATV